MFMLFIFFFSSRRRHTRCALVTGVQTCALPILGKSVPAFSLPPMLPDRPGLDSADYATGEPRIVNVFASWCVPCIAEAPQLEAIAERGIPRSEERRVGKECVSTCRSRWSPYH